MDDTDTDELSVADRARLHSLEELLRSHGYVKDDLRGFWLAPGVAVATKPRAEVVEDVDDIEE